MLLNLANHRPFTACTLIAASTDLRLLPIRDSHSTQHGARRTLLIPSSPANGIILRIIEGDLPRKVSDNQACFDGGEVWSGATKRAEI